MIIIAGYHEMQFQIWDVECYPFDSHCRICSQPLNKAVKVSGSKGKPWLLTKCGLQEISIRVKVCPSGKCRTRLGFIDWRSGV